MEKNNESTRINFIHLTGNPIVHIDFDKLIEKYGDLYAPDNTQDLVDPEWLSENENKQAFF